MEGLRGVVNGDIYIYPHIRICNTIYNTYYTLLVYVRCTTYVTYIYIYIYIYIIIYIIIIIYSLLGKQKINK